MKMVSKIALMSVLGLVVAGSSPLAAKAVCSYDDLSPAGKQLVWGMALQATEYAYDAAIFGVRPAGSCSNIVKNMSSFFVDEREDSRTKGTTALEKAEDFYALYVPECFNVIKDEILIDCVDEIKKHDYKDAEAMVHLHDKIQAILAKHGFNDASTAYRLVRIAHFIATHRNDDIAKVELRDK